MKEYRRTSFLMELAPRYVSILERPKTNCITICPGFGIDGHSFYVLSMEFYKILP